MWIENIMMALSAVRANKIRSFLTMLGIIIGIGSVISIVSIGDTMRGFFADLYKNVGSTKAYISIGNWVTDMRASDQFTLDELERIKELFGEEITYIDSSETVTEKVSYKSNKMEINFTGIDYNFNNVESVEIIQGRFLNEADILGRKKNVLIEDKSALSLFGTENAVGKTFRTTIHGDLDDYTIIGVYRNNMNALQSIFLGINDGKGSAYIPYTILTIPNERFMMLRVYAADDIDLDDFFSRLLEYVTRIKNRNTEDFYMYRVKDEMVNVDEMMRVVSIAVGGIAAISLLVGGIGIMNIMLVSVTERTREIGIRKSLGAKTADIMIQFLIESAILSSCGGIIGILIGVGLIIVGGVLFDVQPIVKLPVIIMAVGFSVAVGIFFGMYPASKAAKKDPIEALRYE